MPTNPQNHAKVCIILVNWNGWRDTVNCITSLLSSEHQNFRIIVCDNASSDHSIQEISRWANEQQLKHEVISSELLTSNAGHDAQTRLLLTPTGSNLGFAAACNLGLRHVIANEEYAYVWLLNNDTLVQSDTLSKMLSAAAEDVYDRPIGSEIYDRDGAQALQVYGGQSLGTGPLINPRHCLNRDPACIDFLVGASIFLSRSRLTMLGLLDERFFLNAEDLVYTLGYQRTFRKTHPDVMPFLIAGQIWHKESSTQGRNRFLHCYYYSRNILLVARDEGSLCFITTLLHAILRVLKATALLRFSNARGIMLGILHALGKRQGIYPSR